MFRIIDAATEGGRPLYAKDAKGNVVPATITMPMLLGMQKQKDNADAADRMDPQIKNRDAAVDAEKERLRSTPDRLLSPAKREEKVALPNEPLRLAPVGAIATPLDQRGGASEGIRGLIQQAAEPGNPRTGGAK